MARHIVITGISGFIGANLAPFLKESEESIIGVSRNSFGDSISYEELNLDLLNKSKTLIHLAGKAHDLKKVSLEQDYVSSNTELTKDIFNTFLESKCETFIYMSSVKASADTVQNILTENILPNPITSYGKSKLAWQSIIRNLGFI